MLNLHIQSTWNRRLYEKDQIQQMQNMILLLAY